MKRNALLYVSKALFTASAHQKDVYACMCLRGVHECVSYQTSWCCTVEFSEDPGLTKGIQQHPHDREEQGQDGQNTHQLQIQ